MPQCPCTSKIEYEKCCAPFIKREKNPPTAEALMRSRYSAYAKHAIEYIEQTHAPEGREEFDREAAKAWSENTEWLGLEIKATEKGQPEDDEGVVEFVAHFKTKGKEEAHHEVSLFKRIDDQWFYVDGKTVQTPVIRTAPKLGRNDPCSCGSGKKFKKCCAA